VLNKNDPNRSRRARFVNSAPAVHTRFDFRDETFGKIGFSRYESRRLKGNNNNYCCPRLPWSPAGGGGTSAGSIRLLSSSRLRPSRRPRPHHHFHRLDTRARTVFFAVRRRRNDATPGVVCQVSGAPARRIFAAHHPPSHVTRYSVGRR